MPSTLGGKGTPESKTCGVHVIPILGGSVHRILKV